jgi:uncharacterized YigZ family protein
MLQDDTYQTIVSPVNGLYKEKGSRFIACAFPVASEDEIKNNLSLLRREYHDARHHCYAYRLGADKSVFRFNDDGEPSGTAGRPIFGQIVSMDLTQILIVVIRYFGGIKLGVPGLINAYRMASKDALDQAKIVLKTVNTEYLVRFDHPAMNHVMKIMKEENASILQQGFEDHYILRFIIRKNNAQKVFDRLVKQRGISVDFLKEF